jgi:hypothetical protein
MSRSLAKFTFLAALAAPLTTPGAVFAQVCNPALADSSMNRCPPINDGGGSRIDHRPDRMPHGDNGMHPGSDMHGNPGVHGADTYTSGATHSGGMGHGGSAGGAGGGAGGGHGK